MRYKEAFSKIIYVLIFLCLGLTTRAQELTQTIRGEVRDEVSGSPIAGAHITILNSEAGASTDESGRFTIEEIALGRYMLQFSHASYEPLEREVLLEAGKEVILQVLLREAVIVLDEVEVANKSYMTSDRALSGRQITMEQTNRIPANFFDPVRVATSFPGVAGTNDQTNNLVIRGHSPNTMRWRLEGLNIVNPNHTSNAGTFSDKPVQAGGGVNILSGQMLGNTRFIPSPVSADGGNGFSIFDLKFREGNNQKTEYTVQASLIGLDFAAEGPLGKGSFLLNYRYSFVGIITGLGVDFGGESIAFQDIAFHVSRPLSRGKVKFFGFWGQSKNNFTGPKDTLEWKMDKDRQDIFYRGNTGALGFTLDKNLDSRSSLQVAGALSGTLQTRDFTFYDPAIQPSFKGRYQQEHNLFSSRISFKRKLSAGSVLEIGSINDFIDTGLYDKDFSGESMGGLVSWYVQPYLKYMRPLSSRALLEAGMRYAYLARNGSGSIEPRLAFWYDLTDQQTLGFGYALNSLMQTPQVYISHPANSSLGFTRAHVLNFNYQAELTRSLKFNGDVYYQQAFDVPVSLDGGHYSVLNTFDEFMPLELKNDGKGRNYGVEVFFENALKNGKYLLAGSALYDAEYLVNQQWEVARYNGRYNFNVTYGAEKQKDSNGRHRVFNYNVRAMYLGGFNALPVDERLSELSAGTVYDYGAGYTQRMDNYFRMDLSLIWKRHKPGYTRVFSVDVQNLLNRANESYTYYDHQAGRVITARQLGIIPVVAYRLEF
ncbi:MAG: TonB-dependent receptor [Cyclobacteriaceae bacterium]|nr:TonB-dependent receptor [Cyclobacteriaceae bacterium]